MKQLLSENQVRGKGNILSFDEEYLYHYFRRQNTRKPYFTEVLFSVVGPEVYTGIMENISHSGARIETNHTTGITAGDKIIIIIPFAKKEGAIKQKAVVQWYDKGKIGIEFT